MEAFKLQNGRHFKVMYYGEHTPDGKERTVLVKKDLHDRFFVNVDGGTDLKMFLMHRVGRVDPISIGSTRPVTRSMHRALSQ